MSLPINGKISMCDVNLELKKNTNSKISLNDDDVRKLAGISTGKISLDNLKGKSSEPAVPEECDYFFETRSDFDFIISDIISDNNGDLSQKTFGFGDFVYDLNEGFKHDWHILKTPKMIVSRNIESVLGLFYGCKHLTTVSPDLFKSCKNINNFEECFYENTSLKSIPADLFKHNTKAISFRSTFDKCYSIKSIPENLFINCKEVLDFSSCFYISSILNIPEKLFSYSPKVKNFAACFYSCKGLTEIPENLFINNAEVTDFSSCFSGCENIKTIPGKLFSNCVEALNFNSTFHFTGIINLDKDLFKNCIKIEDLGDCFDYSPELQSVPDGFFDSLTRLKKANSCFSRSPKLTYVPFTLFDNCRSLDYLRYCFAWCEKLTSAVPDVWESSKFPNLTKKGSTGGYVLGTPNVANYSQIPDALKNH